jgi:hypothetical protein
MGNVFRPYPISIAPIPTPNCAATVLIMKINLHRMLPVSTFTQQSRTGEPFPDV